MIMQEDMADLLLLKSNPIELLMKYQQVFALITRRYARSGYYHLYDCEDVLQHVNERMFSRLDRIVNQYNGRVLVRTYLSVICRNAIMEYLRMNRRRNLLYARGHVAMEPSCVQWQEATLFIRDEFHRLEKVMCMIGPTKPKLLLIMKLIYRIKVDLNDFSHYNPETLPFITDRHLDLFNNSATLKDKDIYQLLMPIMQHAGAQIFKPDTIRRWFNNKTEEVIGLMNGNPARSFYTNDTLQILIEKYYAMIDAGTYKPITKI